MVGVVDRNLSLKKESKTENTSERAEIDRSKELGTERSDMDKDTWQAWLDQPSKRLTHIDLTEGRLEPKHSLYWQKFLESWNREPKEPRREDFQ